MADKYSAQWWNDQARASGSLTKSAIESLTGMSFNTVSQDSNLGTIVPWYKRVIDLAPGFASSGLLLNVQGAATPTPSGTAATNPAEWANWPTNYVFVSPVGYVAPGTSVAYNPTLTATAAAPSADANAYLSGLWAIATGLENSMPRDLARLRDWTDSARKAGVAEANIIAVLRSWNAWEDANATLRDITIPTEMKRVQSGGSAGAGDLTPYRGTNPPNLPAITTMLTNQGGALEGDTRFTGTTQTQTTASPPVQIPQVLIKPGSLPGDSKGGVSGPIGEAPGGTNGTFDNRIRNTIDPKSLIAGTDAVGSSSTPNGGGIGALIVGALIVIGALFL